VHYTVNNQEYSPRIPGLIVGSVFLLGGTFFNIVRSALYHKPHPKIALLTDPELWNIAVLPGKNGIQVHLSYTLRF
jgi:hypothetical protein